jgi:hypothetical protein
MWVNTILVDSSIKKRFINLKKAVNHTLHSRIALVNAGRRQMNTV